ncbi:MAG TPA: outer membrane beta-barrel protein [Candidatus Eisenbacteria bacterium]|nr:outer membrane beta-barrel protein [Candidatus Eisenbacteria bacterium]
MNGPDVTPGTFALIAMAAALLLAAPAPSHAETRFGIAGFAGYNSHSMEDANELIDEVNDGLAGTGFSMDEITSSWGFGGGLRIRPSGDKLMIALDYEKLNAGSELEVFGGSFEIETPADAFTGTLLYLFPSSSRARIGVGAGVGYYSGDGEIGADSAGVGFEIDVEGSGFGFHGLAALDYGISPVVHLEGSAGYRFAETSDLEVGGQTAYNLQGEEATLDWSGFMSRVGLAFYFGAGAPSTSP